MANKTQNIIPAKKLKKYQKAAYFSTKEINSFQSFEDVPFSINPQYFHSQGLSLHIANPRQG
jgi:hypothetical protein